jgi:hypothetical protein
MTHMETEAVRREIAQRLADLDAKVTQRFDFEATARAAALDAEVSARADALAAMDKRLGLLNELRTGILTRDEFEAKHKSVEDRLHGVERLVWMAAGASGLLGGIIAAAIARLLK